MRIHNGDHAQYEIDNADVPPKERSDWPYSSFSALDWAEAFGKKFIVSEIAGYKTKPVEDQDGLMLAWFASALMRGYDEHASNVEEDRINAPSP